MILRGSGPLPGKGTLAPRATAGARTAAMVSFACMILVESGREIKTGTGEVERYFEETPSALPPPRTRDQPWDQAGGALIPSGRCPVPEREVPCSQAGGALFPSGKCPVPEREVPCSRAGSALFPSGKCLVPEREEPSYQAGGSLGARRSDVASFHLRGCGEPRSRKVRGAAWSQRHAASRRVAKVSTMVRSAAVSKGRPLMRARLALRRRAWAASRR